jgi:hypothetical protein
MGTLYAHSLQDNDYADEVAKVVKDAVRKVAKNPSHD